MRPEIESVVPGPEPRLGVEGSLDAVDAQVIFGWAWNPTQPGQRIQVRVWDGDTPLATVTADQFRQDLLDAGVGDGKHGFSLPIPASLRDDKPHTIRVMVDGAVDDLGPHITLTPTQGTTDAAVGFLDEVNDQVVCGWAWDSMSPESPLDLEIYCDETKVLTVCADEFREDLQDQGIGKHGFTVPTPEALKDGITHRVFLKLSGTGRTLAERIFSTLPLSDRDSK